VARESGNSHSARSLADSHTILVQYKYAERKSRSSKHKRGRTARVTSISRSFNPAKRAIHSLVTVQKDDGCQSLVVAISRDKNQARKGRKCTCIRVPDVSRLLRDLLDARCSCGWNGCPSLAHRCMVKAKICWKGWIKPVL
jgi:hypothetical protein